MNLGLSSTNKNNFANTIPVVRPLVEKMAVPHPQWMAGFVSGEGSFSINTSIQAENKSVSLSFRVSQHIKDEELLKSFVNYFGARAVVIFIIMIKIKKLLFSLLENLGILILI